MGEKLKTMLEIGKFNSLSVYIFYRQYNKILKINHHQLQIYSSCTENTVNSPAFNYRVINFVARFVICYTRLSVFLQALFENNTLHGGHIFKRVVIYL